MWEAVVSGIVVGVVMLVLTPIINYFLSSTKRKKGEKEKERLEREEEINQINESIKDLTASINEKFGEQQEDMKLLKAGLLQSLRIGLDELYDKYNKKKWASTEERESVQRVFDAYKALGGNGLMKMRHEEFLKLPNTPPISKTKKKEIASIIMKDDEEKIKQEANTENKKK